MRMVLVVDDNADMRETVADSLRSLPDIEVSTASSGKKALEYALTNRVDLVITDAQMPETNGIELLIKLKKMWPRLPVVVMSGDAGLRHRAIYTGADHILPKPFNPEQLSALVLGLLHQYPGSR